MRRGPPPNVAGWYGEYHPDLWVVPSQQYPNFVPRRVYGQQFGHIPLVLQQWGEKFEHASLVGVPSADRKSIVYDFVPTDPSGPWYSSCKLEADPGLFPGYFSPRWTFVYGFSTLVLSVNYLWGPRTTGVQFDPVFLDATELLNGVETHTGSDLGLLYVRVGPENWDGSQGNL